MKAQTSDAKQAKAEAKKADGPALTGKEAYEAQKALKRKRQQLEKKVPQLEKDYLKLEAEFSAGATGADMDARLNEALEKWRAAQADLESL